MLDDGAAPTGNDGASIPATTKRAAASRFIGCEPFNAAKLRGAVPLGEEFSHCIDTYDPDLEARSLCMGVLPAVWWSPSALIRR